MRRQRFWRAATLATLAFILTFIPVFLMLLYDIWPPTAMVQETFTLNFSNYSLMRLTSHPYHLVPVGHFQILVLSYPPSAIVDFFFSHLRLFKQFYIFALLFYVWSGLLLIALIAWVMRSSLPFRTKVLLTLLPFGAIAFERGTYLGLHISYDRAEALVYLALAWMILHHVHSEATPSRLTTALVGALAGLAIGIKWTQAVVIVPICLVFGVAWARARAAAFGIFVISFVATVTLGYLLYFMFRIEYLIEAFRAMVAVYRSDWLSQPDPDLFRELFHPGPPSFYVGFQLLLVAFVIGLACLVAVATAGRDRRFKLLLVTLSVPTAALSSLLLKRSSQSTMVEVILFVTFVTVITLEIAAMRMGPVRLVRVGHALFFAAFALASVFYDGPLQVTRLRANSAAANRLERMIKQHSDRPIVYYLAGETWEYQGIIFPDPALMMHLQYPGPGRALPTTRSNDPVVDKVLIVFQALLGRDPTAAELAQNVEALKQNPEHIHTMLRTIRYTAEAQAYRARPIGPSWMEKYLPTARFTSPAAGLQQARHLAIVPEVLDVPSEKGLKRVEMSQDFRQALQQRSKTCDVFQFHETQARRHRVHVFAYQTRVSACAVDE
jgi:hypothetical protein